MLECQFLFIEEPLLKSFGGICQKLVSRLRKCEQWTFDIAWVLCNPQSTGVMYTEVLQEIAQPTTNVQLAVKVYKIYVEKSYDGTVPVYQLRSGVMHKRHQFRCKPAPPVHHRSFWRWWRWWWWWSTMILKKRNNDVDDIDVQFLAQSALSGWVWMLWASSILRPSTVSLYKDCWSSCDKLIFINKKRDFQLCFLLFW